MRTVITAFIVSSLFSFSALAQAPAAKPVKTGPAATVPAPGAPNQQLNIGPMPTPGKPFTVSESILAANEFIIRYVNLSTDKAAQAKFVGNRKLSDIVGTRSTLCKKDIKTCSDITHMKEIMCSDKFDAKVVDRTILWAHIADGFDKDDKGMAAFIPQIASCNKDVTTGKLLGLGIFADAAIKRHLPLSIAALEKTLGSQWNAKPVDPLIGIDTLDNIQAGATNARPIQVPLIRESVRLMLRWMGTLDARSLPPATIEKVVTAMNFTLPNMGDGKYIVDFIQKNPKFKAALSPKILIEVLDVQCNYWRESNQASLCTKEVEATRKMPGIDVKNDKGLKMEDARTTFAMGDYDGALKKMNEVKDQATKDGAKDMLPWINALTAIVEAHAGKLQDAQNSLAAFEKSYNTVAHRAWYGFYLPSLKGVIQMQAKDYDTAEKTFTKLRSDITGTVHGSLDILAWTDLHLMMVKALKGDKKAVDDYHTKLKASASALPSYQWLGQIGDAVAKASKGTYASADLDPARKSVGAKYPDIQRFEELISRLKK